MPNLRTVPVTSLCVFSLLFSATALSGAGLAYAGPPAAIIVDGVRYAPEDISRFDGQILRYVLDERGERVGVIHGFTTVEGLMQYLKEQWGWEPATVEAAPVVLQLDSDSYWTVFYENNNYGGSTLSAAPNVVIPNLGNISPGWNDRISSVKVATGVAWATLYADNDYAGDQLWMQRGTEWSSLSGSGWDNRASSIKVWLQ